jgi:hypothetical protein
MIMVDLERANSRVATVELRNVSFFQSQSFVHRFAVIRMDLQLPHSVRYIILWVDIQSPFSLLCKHLTLSSYYRDLSISFIPLKFSLH